MKASRLFHVLLACTTAQVSAQHESPYFNKTHLEAYRLMKRQNDGNVITTGTQGTGIQPRLEIRQMESQQSMQMTLLFLAMQYFQGDSQSDDTGYWGISKIHGVPRQDWDGVSQCSDCQDADGYCMHSVLSFPCFHRAYMALFEQQFLETVQAMAAYWPDDADGDQFRQAAATMRLPFWDWAAVPPNGGPTLPLSMSSPQVTLYDQSGTRKTIDNPLYSFHFQDPSDLYYADFTTWSNTLRYPTTPNSDATSQEQSCIDTLDQNRPNQQSQLYTLLTGCSNYFDFSNDVAGGSGACVNSLEQLHNNIHDWTGGSESDGSTQWTGHMTVLPEAAFDPSFWFHHAMVDRLFALWQALHSDYGNGASSVSGMDTWTYPQGYTYTMDTALTPFRYDDNTFWTCNTVQNYTQFGYTYPEFVDSDGSPQAIQNYIDELYGPNASGTAGSTKRSINKYTPVYPGAVVSTHATSQLPPKSATSDSSRNLYFADITTPKFALNGSYYVMAFLGSPSTTNPAQWITDKNLIGSMGVFSKAGHTSNTQLSSGQIPIARDDLPMLPPDQMTDWLKKNFKVYIVSPLGKALNPKTVQGFAMNITSSVFTPSAPAGQKFSPFSALDGIADDILSGLASLL